MKKRTAGLEALARISLAGALASVAACDGDMDLEVGDVDTAGGALVGGRTTSTRPDVGALATEGGSCTATLIMNRYLISAAHCLDTDGVITASDYTDTTLDVNFRFSGPGYQRFVDKAHSFATRGDEFTQSGMATDFVLMRLLSPPLPGSIVWPATLSSVLPDIGAQATTFGYGCQDRVTLTPGPGKQYLTFNYGDRTTALCYGDSGGPVVLGTRSAGGAVWGVNSAYDSNGTDVFADVPYYKPQILGVIKQWEGTNLEVGVDCPGMDYWHMSTTSASACRLACFKDWQCLAFTWVSTTQECFLKSGIPDWVPNENCTSGADLTRMTSYDRPGNDLRPAINLTRGDPDLCLGECARDSSCRAYTYVKPGVQGTQAKCYLKSSDTGSTFANSNTTSGARRGVESNTDRPGRTYSSIFNSSTAGCQVACARDERCRAWTYRGSTTRICELNSEVTAPVVQVGWVSGIRRGLEMNINRGGFDILPALDLDIPAPEICQASCAREPQCQAWSYVKPGIQGPKARCWLKSSIPAATIDNNTVSGIKGLESF